MSDLSELVGGGGGGGGAIQVLRFYSSTSWTVPDGVTKIYAEVVGGGGGASVYSGASAGGGGMSMGTLDVTPGTSVSITIGAGGAGGTGGYGGAGANGGNSSISSGGTTLTGNGGNRGTSQNGSGGSGYNGNIMTIVGQTGSAAGTSQGGATYFAPQYTSTRNSPGVGGYSIGNSYASPGMAGSVIIWYVG